MMSRQYVTFYLDQAFLGIDVMRVQELLPPQPMTPVPLASKEIRGLINLRGNIVPAVDLRLRLGLGTPSETKKAMNVIIACHDGLRSFLVDRIGDVLRLPVSTLESAPLKETGIGRQFTSGVHQLENNLLVILDIDRICGLQHQHRESGIEE